MAPYHPGERICTDRLKLRRCRLNDAEAIYDGYATDPDVTRYLGWAPHTTISETVSYLENCESEWSEGRGFPFVIESSDQDELIGMIHVHPGGRRAGYGYVLRRSAWGQGFAAEALRVLVEDALGHPDIYRTFAFCDCENTASARVMEKAGMEREGMLRSYLMHPNVSDEPRDCLVYARVR